MQIHKSKSYPEMFMLLNGILILALLLSFGACSSNSTGTNGGGGGGGGGNEPPPEPTFSNVQTILSNSCGGSGCHINETTSGVRLDSYDNVINSVGDQYGENIVQPNEPNNSPIVDKIESNPEFGERMPLNGSPLTSDQITLIRNWINEGAKDN